MFKKRIKNWGMDKNHLKSDEVGAAVLCKRQRDAVKKKSKIIIRGREVEWQEIQRHLSRNPTLQSKLNHGTLEIGSSAAGVLVRTPSPDPAQVHSIRCSLAVGGDLHAIEDLSSILIGYFNGALDSGIWGASNGVLLASFTRKKRADEWSSLGRSAFKLIFSGNINSGFKLLHRWFDHFPRVLRDQSPELIPTILNKLHYIRKSKSPQLHTHQLENMVRGHVARIAKAVQGAHHPFTAFCTRLQNESSTSTSEYIHCLLEPLKDLIANRLQTAVDFQIWVRGIIAAFQIRIGDYDSAIRDYQATLNDNPTVVDTYRRFITQLSLCSILLQAGRLEEAEAVWKGAQWPLLVDFSWRNPSTFHNYWLQCFDVYISQAKMDMAGALRKAANLVRWIKQQREASHPYFLDGLRLQVNVLRWAARHEEANALSLEIDVRTAAGSYEID